MNCILDTGLLATIGKYVNRLDDFIVVFPQLQNDQLFWIEMYRQRFPHFLPKIKINDWRGFYEGTQCYENKEDIIKRCQREQYYLLPSEVRIKYWKTFQYCHRECLIYLLSNFKLDLLPDDVTALLDVTNIIEVSILILRRYPITYQELSDINFGVIHIKNKYYKKLGEVLINYRGTDKFGNEIRIVDGVIERCIKLKNVQGMNTVVWGRGDLVYPDF